MSIENFIKSQQDAIMNDINQTRESVFAGLVTNVEVVRIPESLFVNRYLPAFLGNPPVPDWVVEWISIAGSPSSMVDVFSDSTGEILFRVPPLIASGNIQTNSKISLKDVFSRADQLGSNIPQQGTRFLNEALYEIGREVNPDISGTLTTWGDIIARYRTPEQDANTQQSNSDEDLDSFFEY